MARCYFEGVSILAPAPDFRYVGLSHARAQHLGAWASALSFGAVLSAAALSGAPGKGLLLATLAAGGSLFALRSLAASGATSPVVMAIVPWGVLIEEEAAPHVLYWAAVKRVHVATRHGREAGASTTLFSEVTVETERTTFTGRTSGAAPLDRLLAYLPDYAEEQARPVAYDLDGAVAGGGPTEAHCEPLLGSVRAYLASAEGADRLGLPPLGYRSATAMVATDTALAELSSVLRSRERRDADPRAFAAVVAAELSAKELLPDLLALVQCPHQLVAAVAKQSARKLGASSQRVGALDEVRPFLRDEDVAQLSAWVDAPSLGQSS